MAEVGEVDVAAAAAAAAGVGDSGGCWPWRQRLSWSSLD